MRLSRIAAGSIVLALIAGACSSTPATPDGKLIIYSGRSESLIGPILTAFSDATGIEVSVKYGETSELAATILEEGDKSPADLFFAQDGGALSAVEAAGLFEQLPARVLDIVPAGFRSATSGWVGTTGRLRVIAYQPGVTPLATIPDSVFGLTAPAWKGKVAWAPTNGSFQAFITAMRVTHGDDKTRTWLEDMIANDTQTFPKNDAIAEAVNNGEVALGLLNHYYPLELAEEIPDADIAVKFLPGDVGGMANAAGIGILKTSQETDAIKLVEYLLSEETQQAFVEHSFEYALIAGIDSPEGTPALDSLDLPDVDLSSLTDLQGTLAMLTEVGLL